MPKHNPKHNQTRTLRSGSKKPNPSRFQIKNSAIRNGYKVKFEPKLPRSSELKRVQQQHEPFLFHVEHVIRTWASERNYVSGYQILNTVGCLIYSYGSWGQNPNINATEIGETNRLDVIELSLFTPILNLISDTYEAENMPSMQSIKLCLECIYNSVQFWTKLDGPTGYLDFVSQFVPAGLTDAQVGAVANAFQLEKG